MYQQKFQTLMARDPAKYPARMGQKWDAYEVFKLLDSIQKNIPIEQIAKDHERTIGSIESYRRKLAVDYFFKEKKSIEEISESTGLCLEQIEEAIEKRKNEIAKTTGISLQEIDRRSVSPIRPNSELAEVILLLKDIQSKIDLLLKKNQ